MRSPVVISADVGSVSKGNFGWWASNSSEGTALTSLVNEVSKNLNQGVPVALGFECPLFVPRVEDERRLTGARPGEHSRAWSAGAGCGALATGLVQVLWALQEIRCRLTLDSAASLDWHSFSRSGRGLFIWEAFVSGNAKKPTHIADARAGAEAFLRSLPDPTEANCITCQSPVYSLVGAALLRSGWTTDVSVLSSPCLVIKAGSTA